MTGQRQLQTAARQAPWIAAIAGIGQAWILSRDPVPGAHASASCALRQRAIVLISAPAITLSALAEMDYAAH